MSIDVDLIKRMAEGDGSDKVLVTKRTLRAIAAELEAKRSTDRKDDTLDGVFGDIFGSKSR